MKKIYLLFLLTFPGTITFAQSSSPTKATAIVLPETSGIESANSRAPQGNQRFIRTCYIITPAELTAAELPAGVILNGLSFLYSVAQSIPTTGSVKIYLQNTTNTNYSKPSPNWSNTTNGVIDNMTLVANIPSVSIPASTGYWNIPFSGGTSFTYSGQGLYVAFEYSNPSGTLSTANFAACNNTLTNSLMNAYSTTSMASDLIYTSSLRPATRMTFDLANDILISKVYNLGKLPNGFTSDVMSAVVVNRGTITQNNISVTLNITGANTYTNIKTISSLSSGDSAIVTFDPFSSSIVGTNNVTVSVPNDDYNNNNLKTVSQEVTNSTISYSDNSEVTGNIGFASASGLLVNRHELDIAVTVPTVRVHISNWNANTGNTVYGVVLDASGNIIGRSANYTIQAADLGTWITFNIGVPPTIGSSSPFYAGLAQVANSTSYYPISIQTETPGRKAAYYSINNVNGGTPLEYRHLGRAMIEADVAAAPALPIKLVSFDGILNSNKASLKWQTTSEVGITQFIVEKNVDGRLFQPIAVSIAKGTNNNTYVIEDANVVNPKNYYRLKLIDKDGSFTYSSVVILQKMGNQFILNQNYPNPVQGSTKISYSIPQKSTVLLEVVGMDGKKLATLVNQTQSAGFYNLDVNKKSLSNSRGTFLYRIIVKDEKNNPVYSASRVMIVVE